MLPSGAKVGSPSYPAPVVSGTIVASQGKGQRVELQAEEFRVAYGTVIGTGFNGRAQIGSALALRGQVAKYWHTKTAGTSGPDWSQLRAMLGVEIVFGANADRLPGGVR